MTDPCCHLHSDTDCCDPADCGPCCENCPTCPTLQKRRVEAQKYAVLDSISVHPTARHGTIIIANYDDHANQKSWRVYDILEIGAVVQSIFEGSDPARDPELSCDTVEQDDTEHVTESQRLFALRMGAQLDMLTTDFMRHALSGAADTATPVLRSSACLALASMLLTRAAGLTPRDTLDQMIDVLNSGAVLQGDRAARRRASRLILGKN